MLRLITICTVISATLADVSHIVKPDTRLLSPFGDTPLYADNPGPQIKQDQSGTNSGSIEIVRQEQNIAPGDGSYNWAYETSNGIVAQEEGRLHNIEGQEKEPSLQVHGSFAYTSPDGQAIGVNYVADENGFQPQGDHLPTPPPIPEAIQRALEWLAAHPESDGSSLKS